MERLYKILNHDAKSAHGGEMDWTPYLPRYIWNTTFTDGKWQSGKWLTIAGDLSMCKNGLHLTSEPLRWFIKKGRIFLAEYKGNYINNHTDKCCFESVRLLCELGIDSLVRQIWIFKMISSSADLSYADLSFANLSYADLRSADLSYANLRYANLRSADLSYADLRSADLSFADNLNGLYINFDPEIKNYKFENGRLWKI